MEKNPLSNDREFPIDAVGLQDILAGGPSAPQHEVQGEIPPQPEVVVIEPVIKESKQAADETDQSDGPDEAMKEQMILPSEAVKAQLKEKYGVLRVVPIPYTREDGKIQTYILRTLTRSQWRAMEVGARKIAESKPDVPAEEIFQEKIIVQACVWPNLPEHEIAASPPGLVPTLFGIVQQMGLFFNPEAIMSVTFTL